MCQPILSGGAAAHTGKSLRENVSPMSLQTFQYNLKTLTNQPTYQVVRLVTKGH